MALHGAPRTSLVLAAVAMANSSASCADPRTGNCFLGRVKLKQLLPIVPPFLHHTLGAHKREQVGLAAAHGTAPFNVKTLTSIGPSATDNCGLKNDARMKSHTRSLATPSGNATKFSILSRCSGDISTV